MFAVSARNLTLGLFYTLDDAVEAVRLTCGEIDEVLGRSDVSAQLMAAGEEWWCVCVRPSNKPERMLAESDIDQLAVTA